MDKNITRIVMGLIIAFILLSAFLITNSSNESINKNTPYPLFPDLELATYTNSTIWEIVNVSSQLNKTFYAADSEISDIVEWYENSENIEEYEIIDGGSSGISTTNIDINNISYGYVKLHKNNKTEGLFLFAIKSIDEMNLEKENLIGIATGPWDIIKTCEKTGNFTEL